MGNIGLGTEFLMQGPNSDSGRMTKQTRIRVKSKPRGGQTPAQASLDFETFVRAAMATGKPKKAKRPAKKRKARK
jgi:hypothetical protein